MNENLTQEAILNQLRQVFDPEIPVNIVDLGLIYHVNVDEDNLIEITMTLTNPNCPVADSFVGQVRSKVESMPGVTGVELDLVWEPPWDQNKMSEAAKLQLGLL